MEEILTQTKKIGKLTREITLYKSNGLVKPFVYATIVDHTEGNPLSSFGERHFRVCDKFPTIESNIQRALRYYKMV